MAHSTSELGHMDTTVPQCPLGHPLRPSPELVGQFPTPRLVCAECNKIYGPDGEEGEIEWL